MSEARRIDWDAIERDYRTGVLSLREIAGPHGVSEGAIRKRAKKDGWSRDLSAKIQAKAEDLVRKEAVRSEVRTESAYCEREVIEANALRIAQVRGEHRADIGRARKLALTLLQELEAETGSLELLDQLGELLRRENEHGVDKLNDLYHKIISSAGRVDSLKKLSETLKNLIGLEREAYGLSVAGAKDPGPGGDAPSTALPADPIEAARAYQKVMQGG